MNRCRQKEAGFTLLEMLIALVVFSIVMLVLRQGFDAATRVFEKQRTSLSAQGDLGAVDRFLRQLIATADPGAGQEGPLFVGRAHGLVLRGPTPHALDDSPEARADMRLSVDEAHRLVLIWTHHRHVIEPTPPPRTRILLEGLTGLDCSYYSDGHWNTTWYGNKLPQLVRLRLHFAEGDPRHWPDIVAAPLLDPMP
ncbi:prepilin-type N-terminal cleavage/methylation domain-containing protein [Asaia spathodeae]|uniref:prepilin-type N-terminal cleavage/methylation domain-containing protein n=1 Tax=Asaia spathodeae TaxID=657016 RepID=UPI002FC3CFCA